MYYCIGLFENPQNALKIDICKNGNRYTVGIYNKETKRNYTNTFDELTQAYAIFEKLVSWCVFGYYSDENKIDYLLTGSME